MSETFRCGLHGALLGPDTPDGCGWCVIDLQTRPPALTLSGEERAAEVLDLLSRPSTTRLTPVWKRIDALVGRPTMTHELIDAERLAAEAADWSGRGDWQRRAVEKACDLMGAENVLVVEP